MYQFNSSVLKRRVLFQFIFEAKETLLWVAGYGRARGGGGGLGRPAPIQSGS